MSSGAASRYAARTSWPLETSNQNDPTESFQSGRRGSMRSSRNRIAFPSERVIVSESPVA